MNIIKKVFKYIEPLWLGRDNKISLRATGSIVLLINFVINLSHSVYKWDNNKSLEGLSYVLGIEAGLITALLGLTAWSNMGNKKLDNEANAVEPNPITVEKGGNVNVSSTTTAKTVNAQNVETVNLDNDI